IAAGAVIVADGVAFTASVACELALHPADVVTVTCRTTVDDPGSEWKKAAAPFDIVYSSVPPVTVQTYVAPAPASVTEALLVTPSQMAAGASRVALGFELTVTTIALLLVLLQPSESETTA